MENMNKLIFVHQKSHIGYLKPINVAFACEVECDLMVETEVEFENQVNNEDSLYLHDSS
jgi:hypothetical protein